MRQVLIDYYNRCATLELLDKNGLVSNEMIGECLKFKYKYDSNTDELIIGGTLKVRYSYGRHIIILPEGFDVLDCKFEGKGCKEIWILDLSNIKRCTSNVDLSEFKNLKCLKLSGCNMNAILGNYWNRTLYKLNVSGWSIKAKGSNVISIEK